MIKELLMVSMLSTSSLVNGEFSEQIIEYNNSVNSRSNNDGFYYIGGYSDKSLLINTEYGYIYYKIDIYKAIYTEHSNLIKVKVLNEFTPGYIADIINPNDGYNGNHVLSQMVVKLTPARYSNDEESALGPKIKAQTAWPHSSSFTSEIASEYGVTANFGNSFTTGVNVGNGGVVGVNVESNNATSLTFSFTKSVSTVTDDPVVSLQTNSNNTLEQTWVCTVQNHNVVGKTTYSLETYYIFELDDSYVNANKDAFMLTYYSSITTKKRILGINWEGETFGHTMVLSCFL